MHRRSTIYAAENFQPTDRIFWQYVAGNIKKNFRPCRSVLVPSLLIGQYSLYRQALQSSHHCKLFSIVVCMNVHCSIQTLHISSVHFYYGFRVMDVRVEQWTWISILLLSMSCHCFDFCSARANLLLVKQMCTKFNISKYRLKCIQR